MTEPILLDFPDQFETERLLLRAPRAGDGPAINEAIAESLPELRRWMPWAKNGQSLDESEAYARRSAAEYIMRKQFPMLIFELETGKFVGGIGLHRIEWEVPAVEIGYWVRTSLQGQGYITEAVNRLTEAAFDLLNARRVCIHCDALNERSANVARRAGFEQEAHLRNDRRDVNDELCDTLIFARVRPD